MRSRGCYMLLTTPAIFFNAGKTVHFQRPFPAHLTMCATLPPLAQFSLLLYIYKELTIVLF